MTPVMRAARAAVGLIVILLAGCDNVAWGGADVAVVPPPPRASGLPAGAEEAGAEELPSGPILFYVARNETGAFMTPVGVIHGDSLSPIRSAGDPATYGGRFIAEFMRQGAEFTLFTRGVRAGTFIVNSASLPQQPQCPLVPTAAGSLELGSGVTATEFLALARADAPVVQARAGAPQVSPFVRSRVAPILAERILRVRRAGLPGNWQTALAQFDPIPIMNLRDPGFAATLLVGDRLGPASGVSQGHSLFFISMPTPSQTGYDTVYVNFRNYAETGRAAPRMIDFLDWTRDDNPELLLQVYGPTDTWFEVIARGRDGNWRRVLNDRCEDGGRTLLLPPPAPPDTAAAAAAPR